MTRAADITEAIESARGGRKIRDEHWWKRLPERVREGLVEMEMSNHERGTPKRREMVAFLKKNGCPNASEPKLTELFTVAFREIQQAKKDAAAAKRLIEAYRASGVEFDEMAWFEATQQLRDMLRAARNSDDPIAQKKLMIVIPQIINSRAVGVSARRNVLKEKDQAQKERELEIRGASKIDAGLKAIEAEVGKNATVKAALDSIREAMKVAT
jgi:hypothetical protein